MDHKPSTSKITSSPATSSSVEAQQFKKTHNKPYCHKYRASWKQDEAFKGWLRRSKKGDTFAYCTACNKHLVCRKSSLLTHSQSMSHKNNFKSKSRQQTRSRPKTFKRQINLENQLKTVETRFALWAVEHNIDYNAMDHLSEIIRNSFIDSEIAKQYTNNLTKCSAIVNNVTGAYSFENTLKLLSTHKFSLIVDELTDKGTIKHLALVCRLSNNLTITDMFLGLLSVRSASANSLYATIMKFFVDNHIDYKSNLIGFASDGASVMMGSTQNSLSVKLKNDIPNLFLMKYSCHSFSLCANYACEKLPTHIEDLARNIYTYFQYSLKSETDLNQFQSFVQTEPYKILQPSQTRWLSLLIVVKTILEQYNALIVYFTNAVSVGRISTAHVILKGLQDPSTKLYYQFLDFVLPFFHDLDLEMQSETIKIHDLYNRIETTLRTILECYLLEDYLKQTDIENIDYKNPCYIKQIENIYLGSYVMGVIRNTGHGLNAQQLFDFQIKCLQFLVEGCDQIYQRFDPKSESTKLLKQLSIISPNEVISKRHQSIAPLAINFPALIDQKQLNDVDREWRQLRNIDLNKYSQDLEISEFWRQISTLKLGDSSPMFPNLVKFVYNLFCLPHSSAAVERVFSEINLNQTNNNKLSTRTLCGLLYTKQLLKKDSCYNYEIGKNLINKINSQIYNKK